ncbi:hypothetical protein BDL97_05G005900 [Sphagnum fallax]|nr:hypothetical protein BDL97_05G005900 [Sphagnum fallax]
MQQLSTEVKFRHARLESKDFYTLYLRNGEALRTLLQEQQRLMWEN